MRFHLYLSLCLLHLVNLTGSKQLKQSPPPGNNQAIGYAFQYGVRDEASGTLYAHTESRNGLTTTGQYTVHLPDGRIQTVKYTADQGGYRATVSYDGVAHHPDKIVTPRSRAVVNYPPVRVLQRVPVVRGNAVPRVPVVAGSSIPRVPVVGGNSIPRVPVVGGSSIPRVPVVGGSSIPRVPVVGGNSIPRVPGNKFSSKPILGAVSRPGPPVVPSLQSPGRFSGEVSVPIRQGVVRVPRPLPQTRPNLVSPVNRQPIPVVPARIPVNTNFQSVGSSATSNARYPAVSSNIPSVPRPTVPIIPVPFSPASSVHRNTQLPVVPFVQTSLGALPVVPAPNFGTNYNSQPSNAILRVPPPTTTIVRPRPRIPPQNTYIPTDVHPSLFDDSNHLLPDHRSIEPDQSPQEASSSLSSSPAPPVHSSPANDEITIKSLRQLTPPYQDSAKRPSMKILTDLSPPYPSEQSSEENDGAKRVVLATDVLQQSGGISHSGKSQLFAEEGTDFISNSLEDSITKSFSAEDNFDVYPSLTSTISSKDLEQADRNRLDQPVSRPSQFASTNPFEKPSLDFSPSFHPSQGIAIKTASGVSFIVDPDASVFHNDPSILIDYGHRGTSHEDDSDSVPLTAPYVHVGGAYSSNPESNLQPGSGAQPQSGLSSHPGIALPDAAEAGNVRLSPESLPPHLAKLQEDREEISTKPIPVKLKLADRESHSHLPLRDKPSTFGSDPTSNEFTPNSLGRNSKLKRSPELSGEVTFETTDDSGVFSDSLLERSISRPIIRNG